MQKSDLLGRKIVTRSLKEAYFKAIKLVNARGTLGVDGKSTIKELMNLEIILIDPIIEIDFFKQRSPADHAWMQDNFRSKKLVPELGDSMSYATRLHDYGGIDQVGRVEQKLRQKPETKSATITTLMPATDVNYIPCISLLDFKMRGNNFITNVVARSIDVENKMPFNIIEIFNVIDGIKANIGHQEFKK